MHAERSEASAAATARSPRSTMPDDSRRSPKAARPRSSPTATARSSASTAIPKAMPWLEREAAAMRAAAAAGVRVPAVVRDGTPSMVGRASSWNASTASTCSRSLASSRGRCFPSPRPPGAFTPPCTASWRQKSFRRPRRGCATASSSSPIVPHEMKATVFEVLDSLPDGDRLCHGDFHPGNILRTDGEPVIIDWPNVTAGDPTADYVRTDLMMRMGSIPPGAPLVIRYGALRCARPHARHVRPRLSPRAPKSTGSLADRWLVPSWPLASATISRRNERRSCRR